MNQKELLEELETADAQMVDALAPKPEVKSLPLLQDTNTTILAKNEPAPISREEAHRLLDRMEIGTLDESLALQRWIKALSPPQLQQEADAFLSKHEHNDKLFLINGYHMLEIYGKINFKEISTKIIAMRPHGMNTYCHVCDTCHYTDPCERYKRAYGI